MTIREDGVERRVTAAEAFLLHMTKSGLAGNGPAGRAAMAAIEEARARRTPTENRLTTINVVIVAPGAVNTALQPLNMAVKLDRFGPNCRMALEPWLVELALARLERRLTPEEQVEVMRATRTPHKVQWPDWWEVALSRKDAGV